MGREPSRQPRGAAGPSAPRGHPPAPLGPRWAWGVVGASGDPMGGTRLGLGAGTAAPGRCTARRPRPLSSSPAPFFPWPRPLLYNARRHVGEAPGVPGGAGADGGCRGAAGRGKPPGVGRLRRGGRRKRKRRRRKKRPRGGWRQRCGRPGGRPPRRCGSSGTTRSGSGSSPGAPSCGRTPNASSTGCPGTRGCKECTELNIPFHLLLGYAKDVLPPFAVQQGVGGLVTDFCPLRVPRQWVEDVRERLPEDVPFVQVDAHNIVPCWVTSPKQEYSARTIRGKIHSQLPEFLTEFPPVIRHPHPPSCPAEPIAWDACYSSLQVDRSVAEVEWATPGTSAGLAVLQSFIAERLKSFSSQRNDPNKVALSNLSPWFHFGQVSTQRAILEVQKHRRAHKESVDAFVEEAVVRRELADNFCYYNENYDSLQGAYSWAQTTLRLHAKDKRPFLYELQQLEQATTHDPLWNAAQLQMVREGKMHGFLRMYWAKKILEWTRSPEEALQFAIYLNDRYELDGRDPNGYVGCLWSICGIHDQGWKERDVFGKIRYMNYSGCKRKFDVDQFERRYAPRELAQ
uniref:Deoxyribodipyrimidine photo-lyase n=1 Tax=Cairina moschata TaxID=8855 RepID=A0A8C3B4M5_CAIMO